MRHVQIRNVPERTHRVLRRRAAASGMSLQEYLLRVLAEHAASATVEEVLERVRTGSGRVSLKGAADLVRSERDSR